MNKFNCEILLPSISNLIREAYFGRNNGYTTNGYWLIRTFFEDTKLKKYQKITNANKIPFEIMENAYKKANTEMEITNILHTTGATMTIEVKSYGWTTIIDAYFLSYVIKNVSFYKIKQEHKEAPLFFIGSDNEKDIINAIIMPIRE